MGHYIRQAELIVITDTKKGGARGHDTVVVIREVIKGEAKLAGHTIVLSSRRQVSTADARVPMGEGVAVLLRPGWKKAERWPVLEAYQKPHEIQALRTLVKICESPNERDRLVALRKVFFEGNPVCREQLFADLRDMRDPRNFDLITDLCPAVGPADQKTLVALIGQIGDLRGVPTLIKALESPDREVSQRAASALRWTFPGAREVTEAFEKALHRKHLARDAAQYLMKRNPDPRLKAIAVPRETRWMRARRLLESGKKDAARAVYLELLRDENEAYFSRARVASLLVKDASAAEKEAIRKAFLPFLARESERDNYLFAQTAAEVLRALRHPDCLDALLRILGRNSFLYSKAARTATMAIRGLGQEARQKATAHVVQMLKSPPPRQPTGDNPIRYVLELVWLGDPDACEEAERVMHDTYRRSWKSVRSLQAVGQQEDEAAFLVQLLSGGARLPREAREWVLFRLGDLRDERAIRKLTQNLIRERGWAVAAAAGQALIAIGGPKVEEEMTKLLTHEDRGHVRRHAITVLFALQGERSLALSRRMLAEKDFGLKGMALANLGRIGTPDDLKLVLPYCDYWAADRRTHYTAMSAAATLRERHNYDLNGPVEQRRVAR